MTDRNPHRLSRRQTLKWLGSSLLLPTLASQSVILPARADSSQSDHFQNWRNNHFQNWRNKEQQAFDHYRQQYLTAFNEYRNRLTLQWGPTPDMRSPSTWVDYQQDTRFKLDLDNNTAEVTIIQNPNETMEQIERRAREAMQQMFQQQQSELLQRDPILTALPNSWQTPYRHEAEKPVFAHLKPPANTINTTPPKPVTLPNGKRGLSLTVPISSHLQKKRAPYLPLIERYSQQYQLDSALVSAIIQTESYFNPMAESHAPAYGLMQIVPRYAGLEVNRHLYQKDSRPSPQWLYNPQNNILAGCTYLHLLGTRHLNGIQNPESRRHCITAAYNTGHANVGRAYTRAGLKTAIRHINQQSPDAVLQYLRTHLPYRETRDYVVKVNQRYQCWKGNGCG